MSDEIKIINRFDAGTYVFIVNSIVSGFFDDKFEFTPHVGRLNAMRLFYSLSVDCVVENVDKDEDSIDKLDALFSNDAFITAFMNAIEDCGAPFSFGSAYHDAIDIVADKKRSSSRVAHMLIGAAKDALGEALSIDNLVKAAVALRDADTSAGANEILERVLSFAEDNNGGG